MKKMFSLYRPTYAEYIIVAVFWCGVCKSIYQFIQTAIYTYSNGDTLPPSWRIASAIIAGIIVVIVKYGIYYVFGIVTYHKNHKNYKIYQDTLEFGTKYDFTIISARRGRGLKKNGLYPLDILVYRQEMSGYKELRVPTYSYDRFAFPEGGIVTISIYGNNYAYVPDSVRIS